MAHSSTSSNRSKAIHFIFILSLTLALCLGAVRPAAAQPTAALTVCPSGCAYSSIQAAIDAAGAGDTINVKPGSYSETAAGRTLFNGSGPYQFGLFIGQEKTGLTLQGVDAGGAPITDPALTAAEVSTNATNSFGLVGIFVEADGVTIAGLKILPNLGGDNKTFEVAGDAFTLKDSHIAIPGGGSVYFNDWRFAEENSHIQSYSITHNWMDQGASVDITSGAGYSGPASGRVIANNRFTGDAADWALISFRGTGGKDWYYFPVGGAAITGNSFSDAAQYIRATGVYREDQMDWAAYWNDNTFDRAVMAGADLPGSPRAYDYATFTNARRIGATVQGEVDNASADDTVLVKAGTYVEQVVIAKSLKLHGLDALKTILQAPATLPIATTPESAILRVMGTGVQAEISGLTVAGPGPSGCGSIRAGIFVSDGANADIHDNRVLDIRDTLDNGKLSGCQNGVGIAVGRNAFATTGTATIHHNLIQGYQKGGIVVDNAGSSATITDNTVTGFGATPSIAQNGIQISRGATADVANNIVSGNLCNHTSCGPDLLAQEGSAGILLYYPGQGTTLTANMIANNDMGIFSMIAPGVTGTTFSQNTLDSNRYVGFYLGEGSAVLTANEIKGSSNVGAALVSYNSDQGNASAELTNNLIGGANIAIQLLQESGSANHPILTAHLNSLQAANAALDNPTLASVDATRNWWQSKNGPTAASVPGGNGQTVTGPASLSPWLCDGTDTQSAQTGFQPAAAPACTASPTRLIFSVQPGQSMMNLLLTPQPVVRAEDEDGNLGINYSGKAALDFGAQPGSANLTGTLVQPFNDGLAAFTDLKIDQAGSGYTLRASSLPDPTFPLLSAAVSDKFDVTAPQADLAVTQDAATANVTAGTQVTLDLHVSNAGPQAAEAVSVTDSLPAGFSLVSATGIGWTCGAGGATVTCTRASLAVGAAPDISLVLKAPANAATLANQASITAATADPASTNNQSSRQVKVVIIPVTGDLFFYMPFTNR